jgi:hypothetical protein
VNIPLNFSIFTIGIKHTEYVNTRNFLHNVIYDAKVIIYRKGVKPWVIKAARRTRTRERNRRKASTKKI